MRTIAGYFIKNLLILGIICWIFDSGEDKVTSQDVKDGLTGFRGITAPLFWVLYIFPMFMMLLLYPFITVKKIICKVINIRKEIKKWIGF